MKRWSPQEGNNDLLLVLKPLDLSGLQISGFLCSATTVGCFGFHEPIWEGGLPINLLLLEPAAGVPSTVARDDSLDCGNGDCCLDVRHTLCGSQTKDCRPITRSFLNRVDEVLTGVVMLEDDSDRKVAIEARLLGWIAWVLAWGGGLTAIEPRLGNNVAALVEDTLDKFSLSSFGTGRREFLGLCVGTGDWGMKLEILLRGSLILAGASGGLFSALLFCTSRIDDKKDEGWAETVAKALVSCFCLAFLSSASWCSRSLTCEKKNITRSQHVTQGNWTG